MIAFIAILTMKKLSAGLRAHAASGGLLLGGASKPARKAKVQPLRKKRCSERSAASKSMQPLLDPAGPSTSGGVSVLRHLNRSRLNAGSVCSGAYPLDRSEPVA